MKLLLTGVTGFLGSHLATTLLADPAVQIAVLVRADSAQRARARVRTALAAAAHDQGLAEAPTLDRMLVLPITVSGAPIDAEHGPLPPWWDRAEWRAWSAGPEPIEVVHCAANLSFKAEDKAAVWAANVDGTADLLNALRGTAVACFNYVSTAYVAGRSDGLIAADRAAVAPTFNNPYEESKFVTERLVADHSVREGLPFRSLRPSIIIGDSRTYRSSSDAGFFKVLAQLKELAARGLAQSQARVHLDLPEGATIDLVTVDAVVTETIALLRSGPATHGMSFHLTSEAPLKVADVFRTCSPQTGIELHVKPRNAPQASPIERLVERGLKHYLPYLNTQRTFDRSNLHACGAARPAQDAGAALDLVRHIGDEYLQQGLRTAA